MNPFSLNRRKRALCILPRVPDARARAHNTETPSKIHESFSRDLYSPGCALKKNTSHNYTFPPPPPPLFLPSLNSTISTILLGANNFQAPVVQKVDSAIYPLVSLQPHGITDNATGFSIAYPLYGDLFCG